MKKKIILDIFKIFIIERLIKNEIIKFIIFNISIYLILFMESNLDKDINKYKSIFIPSNNLHIVTEKKQFIEKVSLNTKNNYPNYDKKLIDIIIDIVINILEKEKFVISIDKLNDKVIENIPNKYASFYYLNKTIYDSIILNIYGNLFKAHEFIDDCTVFLDNFNNYFNDEIKLDKNILKEIHILVDYYNLFLHAKNLFTSTSLEYTTNMVSCILDNKSFSEHCLIICKYVCNINIIKQNNDRCYSKNKIVKSSKKIKKSKLKTIVSYSTFNESNIFYDSGNDEETYPSNISNNNYDFDLFEKDIFGMMDGNIEN